MFRCNKNFPSLTVELISFDAGFDVQNNLCIQDTPLNLSSVHLSTWVSPQSQNPLFPHFRTLNYSYAKISRGNLQRKYKLDISQSQNENYNSKSEENATIECAKPSASRSRSRSKAISLLNGLEKADDVFRL